MGIEIKGVDRPDEGRNFLKPVDRLGSHNTIELRVKYALGHVDGVNPELFPKHLFFVYTNDKGSQSYISGYPHHDPNLDSINRLDSPFGSIVRKGGEYKKNTPDYESYAHVGTISGDPQSVYKVYQDLKSKVQEIHDSNIPYGPFQNSNSTAVTALKDTLASRGIKFELPRDINDLASPGSMNNLNKPTEQSYQEALFYTKELTKRNVSPEVLQNARNTLQNLKQLHQTIQNLPQTVQQEVQKQWINLETELEKQIKEHIQSSSIQPPANFEQQQPERIRTLVAERLEALVAANGAPNSANEKDGRRLQGSDSKATESPFSPEFTRSTAELAERSRAFHEWTTGLRNDPGAAGEQRRFDGANSSEL
jgi:hypothetical protein